MDPAVNTPLISAVTSSLNPFVNPAVNPALSLCVYHSVNQSLNPAVNDSVNDAVNILVKPSDTAQSFYEICPSRTLLRSMLSILLAVLSIMLL